MALNLRRNAKRAAIAGAVAASTVTLGLSGAAAADTGPASTGVSPQVNVKVIKALYTGHTMHNPTLLTSPNGQCLAGMQPDGNFAVYKKANGKVTTVWTSRTSGHAKSHLTLWKSGALAIYSSTNKRLWTAGLKPGKSYALIVQNDCNLVLYTKDKKARWSSMYH